MDLLDYWVHLPGSITPNNEDRNFWYAVTRAVWMGAQFLGQATTVLSSQDSLDDLMESGSEPHAQATPEGVLLEEEEREYAEKLVGELSDERAGWFKSYLAGRTARDEGAALGVDHSTIVKRRQSVIAELRTRAERVGMTHLAPA